MLKERYVCKGKLNDSPTWVKRLASGKGLTLDYRGNWCYNDTRIKDGDEFILHENGFVEFVQKPVADY